MYPLMQLFCAYTCSFSGIIFSFLKDVTESNYILYGKKIVMTIFIRSLELYLQKHHCLRSRQGPDQGERQLPSFLMNVFNKTLCQTDVTFLFWCSLYILVAYVILK